jgi:hypothetical protein
LSTGPEGVVGRDRELFDLIEWDDLKDIRDDSRDREGLREDPPLSPFSSALPRTELLDEKRDSGGFRESPDSSPLSLLLFFLRDLILPLELFLDKGRSGVQTSALIFSLPLYFADRVESK